MLTISFTVDAGKEVILRMETEPVGGCVSRVRAVSQWLVWLGVVTAYQ